MAGQSPLVERRVVTSFLVSGGRVLLVRRSERVGSYRGRWAGISGSIDPGRMPLEQALVELAEETGLEPGDVQLLAEGEPLEVVDQELGRRWVVHPFRFAALHPEKLRLDWEASAAEWVDPSELASYPTVPGLADAWRRVQP